MYTFNSNNPSSAEHTLEASLIEISIPQTYSFQRLHYPDVYIPNRGAAWGIYCSPEDSEIKNRLKTSIDSYNAYLDRLDSIDGFKQYFVSHNLCVSREEIADHWSEEIAQLAFSKESYIFQTDLKIIRNCLIDISVPISYSVCIDGSELNLPIGKDSSFYPATIGDKRLLWNWADNGHDFCYSIWDLLGQPYSENEEAEEDKEAVHYYFDAYDQFRYEEPEIQLVRVFSKLESLGYLKTFAIFPNKNDNMDRLIRKQENYNEKGSLLDEATSLAKQRAESGSIYSEEYKDVYEHLTDETHYDNVSSGGTTIEEVKAAYDSPLQYSKAFERKAVAAEMKASAANMAKASFVTTGVLSGITNMFQVFRDEKTLSEALFDVGEDAIKSGLRGGATGVVSTAIRYSGIKAGSKLLSDSMASTVLAGGLIDGGVALYSYARGEITATELKDELIDTTAKATTTIFFTKAVTAIVGKAVTPILPMVVYTAASFIFTSTREIVKNAKLEADAFDRMTAILNESAILAKENLAQFSAMVTKCEKQQRAMLEGFIQSFDYDLSTGNNYSQALSTIVQFANQAGISLQYADFDDFKSAMNSNEPFRLG